MRPESWVGEIQVLGEEVEEGSGSGAMGVTLEGGGKRELHSQVHLLVRVEPPHPWRWAPVSTCVSTPQGQVPECGAGIVSGCSRAQAGWHTLAMGCLSPARQQKPCREAVLPGAGRDGWPQIP